MKKLKKVPKFKTEAEETQFWQHHDSAEYVDWSTAKPAQFTNLKPSTKTISLRLPENLLASLKILSHKNDVPYQSLIKIFLAEKVREALGHKGGE